MVFGGLQWYHLGMEIHSFHLGGANVAVIRRAVEVLRNGGIVAHPTDTCYGLAVDITNPVALKHLYLRKGMEFDKPVSVLVRSLEEAQKYGVLFSIINYTKFSYFISAVKTGSMETCIILNRNRPIS